MVTNVRYGGYNVNAVLSLQTYQNYTIFQTLAFHDNACENHLYRVTGIKQLSSKCHFNPNALSQ